MTVAEREGLLAAVLLILMITIVQLMHRVDVLERSPQRDWVAGKLRELEPCHEK